MTRYAMDTTCRSRWCERILPTPRTNTCCFAVHRFHQNNIKLMNDHMVSKASLSSCLLLELVPSRSVFPDVGHKLEEVLLRSMWRIIYCDQWKGIHWHLRLLTIRPVVIRNFILTLILSLWATVLGLKRIFFMKWLFIWHNTVFLKSPCYGN